MTGENYFLVAYQLLFPFLNQGNHRVETYCELMDVEPHSFHIPTSFHFLALLSQ